LSEQKVGPSDPRLPFGSRFCRCSVCGKYFNSAYPFDLHRTGHPEQRRCLTDEEMVGRGMLLNAKGYWISEAKEKR
jgi:hypothetical protein